MPPSRALLGGFAIDARVAFERYGNITRTLVIISLRPPCDMTTVRMRNVSECSVLTLCLVDYCNNDETEEVAADSSIRARDDS